MSCIICQRKVVPGEWKKQQKQRLESKFEELSRPVLVRWLRSRGKAGSRFKMPDFQHRVALVISRHESCILIEKTD